MKTGDVIIMREKSMGGRRPVGQQWGLSLLATLMFIVLVAAVVLADEREKHWEYWGRRGYGAPRVSAAAAKQVVEQSRTSWHVGKVQQQWEEDEGVEVRVFINAAIGPIAKLTVHPQTGAILPYRVEVYAEALTMPRQTLIQKVKEALPKLQIGAEAWLGGHGRYWRIPLFLEGTLVSTVKVDAATGELLTISTRKRYDE